ncbi:hypothetical protein RND81_05G214700 [Saponaria officinalis]|uniref:Uncharacterized protein n=1 Tax=Saponaria officinalis TaxID=3572 RepID=A0AAW1L0W7_SAPOF
MAGLKRHVQILKAGKRVACAGSSSAASGVRASKTRPLQCFRGGCLFLKQSIWKIRSRWKHYYLKRQQKGSTAKYRYDAQSYSQNFDSGCSFDL